MQLAENFKMEHLTVKPDVIDAMFRQVKTNETKPYKNHKIPGIIFATEYDLGSNEFAYSDIDFANYRVDTGVHTSWNKGNVMRNDGVDIQVSTDKKTNGYEVFDIHDGEWLQFTASVEEDGDYKVLIRYANTTGTGQLHLENEAGALSDAIELPITEALEYDTVEIPQVHLSKGQNKIKVVFDTGGFHLNYLDFQKDK